jgi:hypothetical protein
MKSLLYMDGDWFGFTKLSKEPNFPVDLDKWNFRRAIEVGPLIVFMEAGEGTVAPYCLGFQIEWIYRERNRIARMIGFNQ